MIYPVPHYIALNISKPKTSFHLTPSLDDVRETQVVDFVRVQKPFVRLMKSQRLINMDDGGTTQINLGDYDGDYTLDVLKNSLKTIDKGIEIIESNGDWFIKSSFKLKLGKGFYTELGVPEILIADKLYSLIWKGQRLLVYCDIIEKLSSYDNIGGAGHISTPSKLLAVVPSQHYPSLRMKSHQRSYLDDFDLSITNIDGSVPNFGMYSFIITLKLS